MADYTTEEHTANSRHSMNKQVLHVFDLYDGTHTVVHGFVDVLCSRRNLRIFPLTITQSTRSTLTVAIHVSWVTS